MEDLCEQLGKRLPVARPELIDGREVRLLIGGQKAKGHIFDGGSLDSSRREHAGRIRVEQQRRHHHRRIRALAAALSCLELGLDRSEIEVPNQIKNKEREMTGG